MHYYYIMFIKKWNTVKKEISEEIDGMRYIAESKVFNSVLLITIIGEFLLPFILKRFYAGYNSRTMVMSALGSPQSPVRLIYNIWLIWLGCFLTFSAFVFFWKTKANFPILSILLLLSIGIFAVGAGLLSGLFSVNESKDAVTTASKIHGIGAAIGFMALLFFPLINGILSFKQNETVSGMVNIVSFILALVCFVCFVMGDKEKFQNTVLKYEGLWERLTLFCMYIPLIYKSVYNLAFFR